VARFVFSAQFFDGHPMVCRVVEDCPQCVVERQFGVFDTWTHANALACRLNELLGIGRLEARFIVTQAFLLGDKLSSSHLASCAPVLITEHAIEVIADRSIPIGIHLVPAAPPSLRSLILAPPEVSHWALKVCRVHIENREIRLRLMRTKLRLALTYCECASLVPARDSRMLQSSFKALNEANGVVASFEGEPFEISDIEAMAGQLESELREIQSRAQAAAINSPQPTHSNADLRAARSQLSARQKFAEPVECLAPAFRRAARRNRLLFASLIHRKLGFSALVRK
jgi:hypothetical protein